MYWPIGTPRIYATSSSRAPAFKLFLSHDGLPSPSETGPASPSLLNPNSRGAAGHDEVELHPPPTPITPVTPAVQSVEHDDFTSSRPSPDTHESDADGLPVLDPILALRASRTGHMFATITATSITVWQTKVGTNLLRPFRDSPNGSSQP